MKQENESLAVSCNLSSSLDLFWGASEFSVKIYFCIFGFNLYSDMKACCKHSESPG